MLKALGNFIGSSTCFVKTARSSQEFLSELKNSFQIFSYSGEITDDSKFEVYHWSVRRYGSKHLVINGEIIDEEKGLIKLIIGPSFSTYFSYYLIALLALFFIVFHEDGLVIALVAIPAILLYFSLLNYLKKRMLKKFLQRFRLGLAAEG